MRVRHPNLAPITSVWSDDPLAAPQTDYAEAWGESFVDSIAQTARTIYFNDPRVGPRDWIAAMTRARGRDRLAPRRKTRQA